MPVGVGGIGFATEPDALSPAVAAAVSGAATTGPELVATTGASDAVVVVAMEAVAEAVTVVVALAGAVVVADGLSAALSAQPKSDALSIANRAALGPDRLCIRQR